MPMDLPVYWKFVKDESSKITAAFPDGFAHITSKEDMLRGLVGGKVCEALPALAAKCIVDNTHRLSTDAEIETFKAERLKREQDLAQKEMNARMKVFQMGNAYAPQPPMIEPARAARKQ
jgi:hypothetical protein